MTILRVGMAPDSLFCPFDERFINVGFELLDYTVNIILRVVDFPEVVSTQLPPFVACTEFQERLFDLGGHGVGNRRFWIVVFGHP